MKNFKRVLEAIEFGGETPRKFYNPQKLEYDETQDEYLHMLYSQSYQKTIERLAHYTDKTLEQLGDYPLTAGIQNLLMELLQFENAHKPALEALAVKTVLDMPECASIKAQIEAGRVKIDAKLSTGELQKAITDAEVEEKEKEHYDEEGQPVIDEEETDLDEDEQREVKLHMDIMGKEEIQERRDFADILRYGESFNHLYSFNLVAPELENIMNPEIIKKYGLASATVQTLYYEAQPGIEGEAARTPNASLGSADIDSEGRDEEGHGVFTIKARAIIFPFLIHEIIKGIMKYVGKMPETRNVQKLGTLEGESRKMRFAPEMVRRILSLVPDQFIKHKFAIYQRLQRLELGEFQEFKRSLASADTTRAKEIIDEIIREMCEDFELDPRTGDWIHEGEDEGEDEGGFEAPQGYTPDDDGEMDFDDEI
jgi:hypothetical protein